MALPAFGSWNNNYSGTRDVVSLAIDSDAASAYPVEVRNAIRELLSLSDPNHTYTISTTSDGTTITISVA